MKYTVPVNFVIDGSSAADVEGRIKDALNSKGLTNFSVHSARGEISVKPNLIPELIQFIDFEIQINDDDPSGYYTDLDYLKVTLDEIHDEDLVENCGYQGDLSDEEFAKQLKEEFMALYNKYGGGTIANDLLFEV